MNKGEWPSWTKNELKRLSVKLEYLLTLKEVYCDGQDTCRGWQTTEREIRCRKGRRKIGRLRRRWVGDIRFEYEYQEVTTSDAGYLCLERHCWRGQGPTWRCMY